MALLTILGLVAAFVGLAAHGVMTPETAALCLVGLAVMLAVGRAMGTGLVGAILRIGIPIIAVLALAHAFSGGNGQAFTGIVAQLCALTLAVFGIYIMVSGVFSR